jgi:hypothetical protein
VTWGVDAAVADARVSESESMKSRLKAGISRIRNMYGLVGEMDMAHGLCALYATTSFSRTCHMVYKCPGEWVRSSVMSS